MAHDRRPTTTITLVNHLHPHGWSSTTQASRYPGNGSIIGCYEESESGCLFVYATPREQPDLWERFLDGAQESYARHDVLSALEYDQIRDGSTTSMFTVAVDPDGQVVGGVRTQGPYSSPSQSHAIAEWSGHPGEALLWGDIEDRLQAGVIESKSGWVDAQSPVRSALSMALARVVLHSTRLANVRYALGTAPQHALRMWESTGCRISSTIPAVPYPDARYQTVVLWWDIQTAPLLTSAEYRPALNREWADLIAGERASDWAVVGSSTAA